MENIFTMGAGALLIGCAIFNFVLYHNIFRVMYFGSVGKSIINELIWCFIFACVEVAILLKAGQFIIKIAGIVIVFGVLIVGIYRAFNLGKEAASLFKKGDKKNADDSALGSGMENTNSEQDGYDKKGNKKVFLMIAVVLAIVVIVILGGKDGGETSRNEVVDLYGYRMAKEEVLLENLEYEQNEFGAYPSLDDMMITCMEGRVYSIVLTDSSVGKYSFLGIQVGDDKEKAEEKLKDSCDFVDTMAVEGNMLRDTYVDNVHGVVIVDYDRTSNIVKSVGYIAEDVVGNAIMDYEEYNGKQSSYIQDTAVAVQYGSYINSKESGFCSAEVGIATSVPGGDYIQVSFMQFDGYELVSFYGMLEENPDGTYTAYDEINEATIRVNFSWDGMEVVVEDALYSDMYRIEGFYEVESFLNFNEVG